MSKHLLTLHSLGMIKPFAKIVRNLRAKIIKSVGYNTNLVPNQLTRIDMITDSLMHFILPQRNFFNSSSIESSYLNLEDTFKRYFGYKHVLPIAQGRMAEIILAKVMVTNGTVIPSNMLFVTTRVHQELSGATVLEMPVKEAYKFDSCFAFKGNMDTQMLERTIMEYGPCWIPYIYVETCVNASGGHPVSMENIKEVSRIAKKYKIPLILDACRILENAYLIKEREQGYSHQSIRDIVKEFCSFSDGCTMSATKDFFVESGGFIATNNQELYYAAQDVMSVFGYGLSVRAKAILNDVMNTTFHREAWVKDRVEKVYHLWNKLKNFGLPVVNPSGGHAVFLDSRDLHKLLPAVYYPEKAFLAHLYVTSGIRAGENILTPYQKKCGTQMIRLAIPTRMYSLRQINYIAKSLRSAWEEKGKLGGLKKISQPPSLSGSFFAKYELLSSRVVNKGCI